MEYKSFYLLRIISSFLIVLLHCASQYREWVFFGCNTYKMLTTLEVISRVAIPLFLMMSGSIFLNINIEKKTVIKQIIRILIIYLIFSIFYAYDNYGLEGITISNVISGYYHTWYLITICWLYGLSLLMKKYLDNKDKVLKSLKIAFFVLILIDISKIICLIIDVPSIISYVRMNEYISRLFDLCYYMFYFVAGYCLSNYINEYKYCYVGVITLIVQIVLVLKESLTKGTTGALYMSSINAFTIVTSICVFMIGKRYIRFNNELVKFISKSTLYIYLMHPYVINLLTYKKGFIVTDYNMVVYFPIYVFMVFGISFVYGIGLTIIDRGITTLIKRKPLR